MIPGGLKYDTAREWALWRPVTPEVDEALAQRFEALTTASFADKTWRALDSVTRNCSLMTICNSN